MMPISDAQRKTLTQLRAELVPSKRDALIAINSGSDKVFDAPARTYRKDGQIERQADAVRDVETGALISTRVITWSYYDTGEVDEITTIETDAKGKETLRRTVKHFLDGTQPEVK